MKIRQGFVSNSSSSSFIINCDDVPNINIKFFELKGDILERVKKDINFNPIKKRFFLTQYMSDSIDYDTNSCNLYEFQNGQMNESPYTEDFYVELATDVWIPKDYLTDNPIIDYLQTIKHYIMGKSDMEPYQIIELIDTVIKNVVQQNKENKSITHYPKG